MISKNIKDVGLNRRRNECFKKQNKMQVILDEKHRKDDENGTQKRCSGFY